ncbi:MAG TPA: hypothetical protein VIK52_14960 [Opitutaceae bacterium]
MNNYKFVKIVAIAALSTGFVAAPAFAEVGDSANARDIEARAATKDRKKRRQFSKSGN